MIAPLKSAATDAEATGKAVGHAERPLRLLVIASLLFPALILTVASVIAYQRQFDDARAELDRKLGTIYEHASKVFDTYGLAARYAEALTDDVDDDKIRADEAQFNARLKSLAVALPQLQDIWLIDAQGRPLVAGKTFPVPRDLDVSDREYFTALKASPPHVYIGAIITGRATAKRSFPIAHARPALTGTSFNGVTIVSGDPDYFRKFYSDLFQRENGYVRLLRKDGAILAAYPDNATLPDHVPADSPVVKAMQENESGMIDAYSQTGETERIFAFRRLPGIDVYVLAAVDRNAVIQHWLWAMSNHLIFGVPATLGLFALSLIALRRTRRATLAHINLQREVVRRETTERALRQAQKMEAVGRLTGGVAHDFNNLLTAILGNVDLALRRIPEKDDRVRRLLGSARQASERAATLVQRLLAFSRQHPQEVKAVDINRLVQGMSELLRRTIGETVTVESVLGGGLWKIAVDPNQLENAILNLCVNSRDAMASGGRLTIETANSHLDENYVAAQGGEMVAGQFVLLAVSDTGTGMSKEITEQAFEPFFTTKPTGAGTGLGLSMVYGFVKQSGGHIKIYSEIDEGTTIKLYFPRLLDASGIEDWRPTEPAQSEIADNDELGDTILLVEDDEEVNRFSTEVLSEEGYHVISTHDAASALRLLDANPNVKMLFTDVVLPGGMNGRHLADEARRRRPELKVLFATGYTRNAIIHQGRLDADVELLTKPFTADVLARKVRQMLDDISKSAPAASPTESSGEA